MVTQFVCVCVCVCVYIYIYTHTHTHTHIFFFFFLHEIVELSFVNLKEYPLLLFLSLKFVQSASQNPSNFKGFLDISD